MPVPQKIKMDINRCFEILELNPKASIDEAKQAYKDLVNIWHPDRFANNPPLKKKAERKLKEINRAYEAVLSFLASRKESDREKEPQSQATSGTERAASHDKAEAKTTTEAFVETGTFAVLSLWSYLSTKLRRMVTEQVLAFKEGAQTDSQKTRRGQDTSKRRRKEETHKNGNLRG